jgi:hypothetical protein
MSCEQNNQVQSGISRRRFFSLGKDIAMPLVIASAFGISANEVLKGTTGISPLDMAYSYLRRDHPYFPLHPAYMEEYFNSAERVIGFPELKANLIEKIGTNRPSSVKKLLEMGLESAHEQGFEGFEGLNMALLTVTTVAQADLEFTAHHYPLFLPEQRSLAIGWDKSRHLLSAAYWAFTLLWLNHTGGLRDKRRADDFPIGLNLPFQLIGRERINQIKERLTQPHPQRNFPFSPEIKGAGGEKWVVILITDGGIAFEILSTIEKPERYYHDLNLLKRQVLKMICQREQYLKLIEDSLAHPNKDFYCGLRDPGVGRDLFANQAGAGEGVALYRLALAGIFDQIPEIPGDDYTEKYGYWDVKINNQGKVIGDFPPEYERIPDGYEMELTQNGVIRLNHPLSSQAPLLAVA